MQSLDLLSPDGHSNTSGSHRNMVRLLSLLAPFSFHTIPFSLSFLFLSSLGGAGQLLVPGMDRPGSRSERPQSTRMTERPPSRSASQAQLARSGSQAQLIRTASQAQLSMLRSSTPLPEAAVGGLPQPKREFECSEEFFFLFLLEAPLKPTGFWGFFFAFFFFLLFFVDLF